MKERVLAELQMITNVVTNDIDYLMYLILKDGTYLSEERGKNKAIQNKLSSFDNTVEEFGEWFSKREEAN